MPDPEDSERFSGPGTFEENLAAILDVDPKDLEEGTEEPEQDASLPAMGKRWAQSVGYAR